MKKVLSDIEFVFPYDGTTTVDVNKVGTVVSDEVAEALAKRYPFVQVLEVSSEEQPVKSEEEVVVEEPWEEVSDVVVESEVLDDAVVEEETVEEQPVKKTRTRK
jgi:hypothetical protein